MNFDAIFGPSPRSDHRPGDTIQYQRPRESPGAGEVLAVVAPYTDQSGRHIPLSYSVDDGSGFPITIYHSDIVQGE